MFRIKICGITNAADAHLAIDSGADCIGLNFYDRSQRFVTVAAAEQIVGGLPAQALKAGVFVNSPLARIVEIADRLGLDLIQLHGDEPPQFVAGLRGRSVVRAFRCASGGLDGVLAYLEQSRRLDALPRLSLLDASQSGAYGGTGRLADWQAAAQYTRLHDGLPPLVIAGGLTADNVEEAIKTVNPAAVDTASGVESSPGQKDPARLAAFISAALRGFAGLPGSPP